MGALFLTIEEGAEVGEFTEIAKAQGAITEKVIRVDQLVFDPAYRRHCEANYCGKYNTNYGCPPDVGTAEEAITRAKGYTHALVYLTQHKVSDYRNTQETQQAAREHWEIASCIEEEISAKTKAYLRLGVGECLRCPRCAKQAGEPCHHRVVSSISAYCVDAGRLAALCETSLGAEAGKMRLIGMILF